MSLTGFAAVDFRAQERDVRLDGVGNHVAIDAPDHIEQLGTRQHLFGVLGEDAQQIELAGREFDAPVSAIDRAARRRRC